MVFQPLIVHPLAKGPQHPPHGERVVAGNLEILAGDRGLPAPVQLDRIGSLSGPLVYAGNLALLFAELSVQNVHPVSNTGRRNLVHRLTVQLQELHQDTLGHPVKPIYPRQRRFPDCVVLCHL